MDQVRYRKQELFNRAYIKGPNRVQCLSITVEKGRKQPPLAGVQISYQEDWVRLHTKTLETAYRATAYYDHYVPDLLAVLSSRPAELLSVTRPLLEQFFFHLGLSRRISWATDGLVPNNESIRCVDRALPGSVHIVEYYQPFGPFEANLSILDLLCNTGPRALEILEAMGSTETI
jgi:WbqC-like protein family